MQVKELMTTNPLCCTPSCTAQIAASVMQQADTGVVPVVEKFGKKVVGVVTDRDLCLQVIASGRNPGHVKVCECMTESPICCRPEDELHTAMELMRYYQVRRILVVNAKNEIEGVISVGDLIRSERTNAEQVMSTLRIICEPGAIGSRPRQRAARRGT